MQQTRDPIVLEYGAYRLEVDIDLGGTLLSLDWEHPNGQRIALLSPSKAGNTGFNGGCFLMAPFANRLADGAFSFDDKAIQLPLNEPANHNAIHGLSRMVEGQVITQTPDTLSSLHPVRDEASDYHYDLIQTLRISSDGVDFGLEIIHRGAKSRPYGIGFHPWFIRTPKTRLSFAAETFFHRDARGLVTYAAPLQGMWNFSAPVTLSQLPWFDAHYANWDNHKALLERPEDNLSIQVAASGALKNLHIYVPDTRDIVCIEPVSHVPDVHNKRFLADYGDLEVLHCDQSLSGHMHIRAGVL